MSITDPTDPERRRRHPCGAGAVAVVQGRRVEHNLPVGPDEATRTEASAGDAFGFGPDHIHRLTSLAPDSVSVHAYSPPPWRMGQYTLGPGGSAAPSVGVYADELRPLDDMD